MLLQATGSPHSDRSIAGPVLPPPASQESPVDVPPRLAALQAENRELRSELDQLRSERATLLERQRRVMELIGTKAPEHLVHDIRNVLNERELLRVLTEDQLK